MPDRPELQNQRQTSRIAKRPEQFVYEYLRRVSGPIAANRDLLEMNTNSTWANPTLFEYTVPSGKVFDFSRVNFTLTDASINPGDFGGIAGGLASGSLFQIIGLDTLELLDFCNGIPLSTNDDFYSLAGIDAPITALAGEDALPVRFSVFRAGNMMELVGGEKIRWTNRDNLAAITKFRAMIQGTFK